MPPFVSSPRLNSVQRASGRRIRTLLLTGAGISALVVGQALAGGVSGGKGGRHDLVDRTVVAEMDHLGAHALQDATHDVDRRVVAVEQARGRHETHFVDGAVGGECFVFCGQVGHCVLRWWIKPP